MRIRRVLLPAVASALALAAASSAAAEPARVGFPSSIASTVRIAVAIQSTIESNPTSRSSVALSQERLVKRAITRWPGPIASPCRSASRSVSCSSK